MDVSYRKNSFRRSGCLQRPVGAVIGSVYLPARPNSDKNILPKINIVKRQKLGRTSVVPFERRIGSVNPLSRTQLPETNIKSITQAHVATWSETRHLDPIKPVG